jgi:hypothetical protein
MPQEPQFASVLSGVSHPSAAEPLQLPQPELHDATPQDPETHIPTAFGGLHAMPQPPQFAVDVCVLISQPFDDTPSQLPQPALQDVTTQLPVEQLSFAFGRLHAVPQAPQLVSEVSAVSQPLPDMPSQLPYPLSQAPSVHVPLAQLSDALVKLHVEPHAPQFISVSSGVSQPFAASPSQLPQPALHAVIVHVPLAHDSEAFGRLHGVPQPPQFMRVVIGVSQPSALAMLQSANPGLQPESWQVPVAQLSPAPGRSQIMPHAPQFVSVLSGVSQPLDAVMSQLPNPELHVPRTHEPVEHDSVAFGRSHVVPHELQSASVLSIVSQPFASTASQLPRPELHDAIAHMPVAQVAVAPAREHATPQAPQSVSVRIERSQPFDAAPSQSS